jgi:hypothetical protein
MSKSGGALPKTRAFLGKVEENVARAPIYEFNIIFSEVVNKQHLLKINQMIENFYLTKKLIGIIIERRFFFFCKEVVWLY